MNYTYQLVFPTKKPLPGINTGAAFVFHEKPGSVPGFFTVLYGLLPGILNLMDLKSATALFWPLISHWQVSLVAALIEAALVWWMLSGRWRGQ